MSVAGKNAEAHLVAEQRDEQRAEGNDENTSVSRDRLVDGIEELCSDDAIYCGPSNACQNIEQRNFASQRYETDDHFVARNLLNFVP